MKKMEKVGILLTVLLCMSLIINFEIPTLVVKANAIEIASVFNTNKMIGIANVSLSQVVVNDKNIDISSINILPEYKILDEKGNKIDMIKPVIEIEGINSNFENTIFCGDVYVYVGEENLDYVTINEEIVKLNEYGRYKIAGETREVIARAVDKNGNA